MQRLTFEELLAFVGLPLAALATIAAIAMVGHKQTRIALWMGLGAWSLLTCILLVQHRSASASDRGAPSRDDSPSARNTTETVQSAAASRPSPSPPVATVAPRAPEPDPPMPQVPVAPAVIPANGLVGSSNPRLDAVRARVVGTWSGLVPESGSPPTRMTLTLHADGRIDQDYAQVRPTLRPGEREYVDFRSGVVKGRLAARRALQGKLTYEVTAPDSIVLLTRIFGQTQREPNALRFIGTDTLVWMQDIMGNSRREQLTLARVRTP